jgi:hypothetical protein
MSFSNENNIKKEDDVFIDEEEEFYNNNENVLSTPKLNKLKEEENEILTSHKNNNNESKNEDNSNNNNNVLEENNNINNSNYSNNNKNNNNQFDKDSSSISNVKSQKSIKSNNKSEKTNNDNESYNNISKRDYNNYNNNNYNINNLNISKNSNQIKNDKKNNLQKNIEKNIEKQVEDIYNKIDLNFDYRNENLVNEINETIRDNTHKFENMEYNATNERTNPKKYVVPFNKLIKFKFPNELFNNNYNDFNVDVRPYYEVKYKNQIIAPLEGEMKSNFHKFEKLNYKFNDFNEENLKRPNYDYILDDNIKKGTVKYQPRLYSDEIIRDNLVDIYKKQNKNELYNIAFKKNNIFEKTIYTTFQDENI